MQRKPAFVGGDVRGADHVGIVTRIVAAKLAMPFDIPGQSDVARPASDFFFGLEIHVLTPSSRVC
jgi:hypothetical protein